MITDVDGYPMRCEMGGFTGNGEWQQFDRILSGGSNLVPFLAVAVEKTRGVALVFSNHGDLAIYGTGDSLLLDDISLQYQ